MKRILFSIFILASGVVFSQQQRENLMIHVGNADHAFFDKVKVTDSSGTKSVQLEDGRYILGNDRRKADISVKNKMISGTFTELREGIKTDFTIENSYVKAYNIHSDGTVINAWRDAKNAYFKEYDPNKVLKSDGWVSLDKNKHYGRGGSKHYFENGNVSSISDDVIETYTEFYPNGNKKQRSGQNIFESYAENGTLYNRQYTKNNVRYNDYYYDGKLATHAYTNKEGNDVTEYYKNGNLDKKETVKNINGEKRILTYDKTGKQTGNTSYSEAMAKEAVDHKKVP